MIALRKLLLPGVFCCFLFTVHAQRSYKDNSVLASGNWFKISIAEEGVYKIDVPFLNKMGITGSISSAQIRIFGNGGDLLPEANSGKPIDDLEENSIWVEDGGDGLLNGSDYILFFAKGPDQWIKDSVNKKFSHKKNIYSDKAFYYLTVGGRWLRIPAQSVSPTANVAVTTFDERYFHELDTVNFLSSGKEWYGEELSGFPGRSLGRSFSLTFSDLIPQTATLVTSVAARSVNTPSHFTVSVNNQQVQQLTVPQIGPTVFDFFAQNAQQAGNFLLSQNPSRARFPGTGDGRRCRRDRSSRPHRPVRALLRPTDRRP